MIKQVSKVFGAIVIAGVMLLATPLAFAQPTLPDGAKSSFDTLEAPVVKVFSAESDGHKFIAYLVKWKGSEVIVNDPLARSNFKDGDTIRFMAQKMSMPFKPKDIASLSFTLLAEPAGAAGGSESPAERKRQMKVAGGDLDATNSPIERFYALNGAAKNALKAGKAKQAEKFANELLQTAQTQKDDWNYGNAIQDGNQILGRIALSKGDVAEAKKRLLASAGSKGSPQMNSFGPNMQLAKELLAKGEKKVVLEYFDRCGKFWKMGTKRLETWSESVNEGQTPDFGASLDY